MTETWNHIIVWIFVGALILVLLALIVRAVRNKWAPARTVKATVTDKRTIELYSTYSGNGKRMRYVVVFAADGKTLPFEVSPFSFAGYAVNQKGTLTYRGNRIIGFE